MKPCVWAVIATYRRPELLQRALASLEDQGPELAGVMIVDNSGGDLSLPKDKVGAGSVKMVTPRENLGTAGGLALGLKAVLQNAAATHCWIMDDDSVAQPGALAAMLHASRTVGAEAVSSLLADAAGKVAWFPGPLSQPAWSVLRSGVTPDEFCQRCGVAPLSWIWATWASMLVTRRAIEAVGLPEPMLWYQGTDIEYTLRISARFRCVLAPSAVCLHLPPPTDAEWQRRKEFWSLQNAAYVAVRLAHGRRILRHLPGNHYRFWKRQHYQARALFDSVRAFWIGAILGRPAGWINSPVCSARD